MYLYSEDCPDDVRQQFGPNKKCPIVYEFYDKYGELVYIGKTTNFCSRWSIHLRSDKPILELGKIVIRAYDSYSEASFVEAQEIAKYKPSWNVHGKEESVSQIDIQHKEIFSLNVLTKKLTEFRKKLDNKQEAVPVAVDCIPDCKKLQQSATELGYRHLVPVQERRHSTAHLWLDEENDTLCKIYSTNGLKRENYKVSDDPGKSYLCSNCLYRHKKRID